jgi:N-methylhydantoinase A
VAAAFQRARGAGVARAITFDMGGTSTDVALIDGEVPARAETSIGGVPLLVPSIDIHTVGAGGGSIAGVDPGGALKVGPQSAGADPGPACYGRGAAPTVTDANVVLGRLRPEAFLGGAMRLDVSRARAALGKLARAMRARSPEAAAEGVVRVVEGTMERALRVITVERGQDPRTCALIAFGGAAGLHACGLAAALGIGEVVLPRDPGLLSAWGVLDGPVIRDSMVAFRAVDPSYEELARVHRGAARTVLQDLKGEGVGARGASVRSWVRMRYLGQSIELEVPLARGFRRAFDRAHLRLLHTASGKRSVEVVGLRVTGVGDVERARPGRSPGARMQVRRSKARRRAPVWLDGRWQETAIFARDDLRPGDRIAGPAIVTEYSSTALAPPGWTIRLDARGNLRLLSAGGAGAKRPRSGGNAFDRRRPARPSQSQRPERERRRRTRAARETSDA